MDGGESASARRIAITEGPWAGWNYLSGDAFEDHVGPFYFRRDEVGLTRTGFIAEPRHMNGLGTMHGGCVLSFADYSLFMIAQNAYPGMAGVTVSLNGEFVSAIQLGARVEGTGEVVKAGKSLVFTRGTILADGAPALTFSGVFKRLRG